MVPPYRERNHPVSEETAVPVSSPLKTLPSKRRRLSGVAALTGIGVAAAIGGLVIQRVHAYQTIVGKNHIAIGVKIAGIEVGGMNRETARAKVREWAIAQGNKAITFIAPQSGRQWNIPLSDVGGRFDIDEAVDAALLIGEKTTLWEQIIQADRHYNTDISPAFLFSESTLNAQLKQIASVINHPSENARAEMTDKGVITLAVREKKGITLDVAATKAALLKNGIESLRSGGSATLVIREEMPRVTSADLGKMGTLLSSFTTDYSSSTSERRHNVELAASKINGTILAPGEEFSYNRIVGPREAKQGWQNALMFQDGEVVPGMGGGVCQVSSTLYNAVLQANLTVKERQNHSIKVHYVSPGRDATVVYGALDFRFVNSTPAPILLLSRIRHRELTLNIYGAKPATTDRVEIVSGPYRQNELGGITVATYKFIHHADGKVTREYLHTDTYRAPEPKRDKGAKVARSTRHLPPVPPPIRPTSTKPVTPVATVRPSA